MDLEKDNSNYLEKQIEDSPKELFQSAELFENLEICKELRADYENKNDSLAKTIVLLTTLAISVGFTLPLFSVDKFSGILVGLLTFGYTVSWWDLLKEKLNNKKMHDIWGFVVRPLVYKKNMALDICKAKKEGVEAELSQNKTKVMFATLHQYFVKNNLNDSSSRFINQHLTNIIYAYNTNDIKSVFDNALIINKRLNDVFEVQDYIQTADNLAISFIKNKESQESLTKNIFKKSKNYRI